LGLVRYADIMLIYVSNNQIFLSFTVFYDPNVMMIVYEDLHSFIFSSYLIDHGF
jgi:hypothetical protein